MAKTFYTERDIEDLARAGVRQILLDDSLVITDVGREKAERLGIRLVRATPGAPGQSLPTASASAPEPKANAPAWAPPPSASHAGVWNADAQLVERVKQAVLTQVGFTVDAQFLDTLIRLVLAHLRS